MRDYSLSIQYGGSRHTVEVVNYTESLHPEALEAIFYSVLDALALPSLSIGVDLTAPEQGREPRMAPRPAGLLRAFSRRPLWIFPRRRIVFCHAPIQVMGRAEWADSRPGRDVRIFSDLGRSLLSRRGKEDPEYFSWMRLCRITAHELLHVYSQSSCGITLHEGHTNPTNLWGAEKPQSIEAQVMGIVASRLSLYYHKYPAKRLLSQSLVP